MWVRLLTNKQTNKQTKNWNLRYVTFERPHNNNNNNNKHLSLGDETDLSQCSFAGWGNEDCSHYEDAGVVCIFPNITLPPILPLRLQGDGQPGGRLEVMYNGTWGSVCDDLFTLQDAQVPSYRLGS